MNRSGLALALAALIAALAAPAVVGAQDLDLDRIPAATAAAGPTPTQDGGAHGLYLENVFILTAVRGDLLVPPPPSAPDPWEERLFLDLRQTWRLAPHLAFNSSARLNFQAAADLPTPGGETARLDLREAYLSWTPREGAYLDVGRINLKSGVALGSNPTDFFKTRAVVQPLSADPSVLREDRLGALMVRVQHVWSGGSATVAYAPQLERQTAIYTDTNLPTLNPMFDRTNAHDRWLAKASLDIAAGFSPEALVYGEGGHTQFGLNLTRGVGRSVVAYLEWSGGVRADLFHDALAFGKATGSIPINAPAPFPDESGRRFRSNAVAGLSYTTRSDIVFNLEYQYFEPGFSAAAWRSWFEAGKAAGPVRGELWYIRSYAADQQSPISQHALFLRVDRQDAIVRNLELTGFISEDLHDGSGLIQAETDYYLSNQYTVGGLLTGQFGRRDSSFGSSPAELIFLLKLARYF